MPIARTHHIADLRCSSLAVKS